MLGLTSDALTVFAALVPMGVGCMIAALSASGWRAHLSWAITGACVLLAVACYLFPTVFTFAYVAKLLGAMLPGVTLILVVLYVGPKKVTQPQVIQQPPDAPDITLTVAVQIMGRSEWSKLHSATLDGGLVELRDKLLMKRISAFGRKAGGDLKMIRAREWQGLKIDGNTAAAVNGAGKVIYTDLQFNRRLIELRWPEEDF